MLDRRGQRTQETRMPLVRLDKKPSLLVAKHAGVVFGLRHYAREGSAIKRRRRLVGDVDQALPIDRESRAVDRHPDLLSSTQPSSRSSASWPAGTTIVVSKSSITAGPWE